MKIDTLSPAFLAGFAGYAITGTALGFFLAALVVWFSLTAVLIVAVAATPRGRAAVVRATSTRHSTNGRVTALSGR